MRELKICFKFENENTGKQGGDPRSIDFCYRIGLDYVSCSPFRVPVARLAAAQVTIKNGPVDPKYGKIYPPPEDSMIH